jgi:DNA-binding MarR family transcriptional regulator
MRAEGAEDAGDLLRPRMSANVRGYRLVRLLLALAAGGFDLRHLRCQFDTQGFTMSARASANSIDEALYDVVRQIRPLHRALHRAVAARLEGSGITVAVRAVLERLLDEGPQTVPQIGRSLGLPRQFVLRTVHAAEHAGLVLSAPNPAHRRSSLIKLTSAGLSRIQSIRRGEQSVLAKLARRLRRDDVEACLRVLGLLVSEFRSADGDRSASHGHQSHDDE